MDERHTEGGGIGDLGDTGMSRDPDRSSAGPANTPMFDREAGAGSTGSMEGGRPPSHRELEQDEGRSEPEPTGERMEGIAPAGSQSERMGERAQNLAERANQRIGETLDRAGEKLEEGKNRAADRLESAANRLHETARRQEAGTGQIPRMAGRIGHRAAHAGEDAAEYLRGSDLEDLRDSLERQVRERPLQTLLLAVAAGWLIGKIVR